MSSPHFDCREWDRASAGRRVKILRSFLHHFERVPLRKFQSDLHPITHLIFTRISTFFRLNYMHEKSAIDLQLQVLQLFLRDETCIPQFLQVGGASIMLDVLLMEPNTTSRKNAQKIILNILQRIANTGNISDIEMICANNGLRMLATSMKLLIDEESENLCRSLFLSIIESNPTIVPEAINSLVSLISSTTLSKPILLSCFILKHLSRNNLLVQLVSRKSINSIFPHLFCPDVKVQLEIHEILMLAMIANHNTPDSNFDCIQYIAKKIISVLTKSSRFEEESNNSSLYNMGSHLNNNNSEFQNSLPVADMARFISRLFQKSRFTRICEFLVDSQVHLLIFDSVVAYTKEKEKTGEALSLKHLPTFNMFKEVANTIREILNFEQHSTFIVASPIIQKILGTELTRSLQTSETNQYSINTLLQLIDTILENETTITECFACEKS